MAFCSAACLHHSPVQQRRRQDWQQSVQDSGFGEVGASPSVRLPACLPVQWIDGIEETRAFRAQDLKRKTDERTSRVWARDLKQIDRCKDVPGFGLGT
jgi:hypothetical protein